MGTDHKDPDEATAAMTAERLSLPETARGPAVDPARRYRVDRLKQDVYGVSDGTYNTIFLTTGEGVICVDAPPRLGPNLIKAITEITDEPVTHVVYSHAHRDHIGAADPFPADAAFIAQEETARILKRAGDPRRPAPTETFAERHTVRVGRVTVELHYPGPNHQPGNSFVYLPEQKVLLAVDLVFPGWIPYPRLAVSQDIPGFIDAHDRLLEFDFDVFVGGHLTRYGNRRDVEIAIEYLGDLRENTADALRSTDLVAIAGQVGFENPWLLIDRYTQAVASKSTQTTLEKWSGRLGGAEVFTHSHAWTMMESMQVD
jgi:glyoxylase-like metal-dependent hydrolase (beta-lactamase superfamily II)